MEAVTTLDSGPLVRFLGARLKHHDWLCVQWQRLHPPFFTCEPVRTDAAFLLKRKDREAGALLALLERGVLQTRLEIEDQQPGLKTLMCR